jgi:hypothetical protein
MSDLNVTVEKYLAVWNETDASARRQKIGELWAENGVYVDPLASVSGPDAFDQVVSEAQGQFKGLKFVRGDKFDAHHNVARFTWNLVTTEGAEPIAIGFDVAVVGADGRIAGVYGFIDKMPAAA